MCTYKTVCIICTLTCTNIYYMCGTWYVQTWHVCTYHVPHVCMYVAFPAERWMWSPTQGWNPRSHFIRQESHSLPTFHPLPHMTPFWSAGSSRIGVPFWIDRLQPWSTFLFGEFSSVAKNKRTKVRAPIRKDKQEPCKVISSNWA